MTGFEHFLAFQSGPRPALELVVSLVVLASGGLVAFTYLRRSKTATEAGDTSVGGARPWRRLGAAICLVLSVMFVLGLYALNTDTPVQVFAAYWIVMLVLVVWLFGLAIRDMVYTRRVLSGYREGRLTLRGEPVPPAADNKDQA